MFQTLFGPGGLGFMAMEAHLSHHGQHLRLDHGHGADLANGKIDPDWDFHSDIPNRMAGGYDKATPTVANTQLKSFLSIYGSPL
mmetsp:Transcript_89452/g.239217  ORF Transcript_89452/g.239217 Transcript_89452/m.239217 type:complete len:84 (+) Transcript_89452:44-295(+)